MGVIEEKIARFIVETEDEEIPPDAIKSAKLGCFNNIGTMLAGAASPPGKIITKFIKEAGGTPEVTVVGTGLRTNPVLGTLANGTFAHILDYDELYWDWGHPSCVLVPPLISLGERMDASGMDILKAYVIGFRVGSIIFSGAPNLQAQRIMAELGFHSTAILGTMAGTAACARLLKLNVEQTIMALGTVGSMAGGLIENFGTYTKGLHAGLASQNAVTACLLAKDGWKSTDTILEGKLGFLHAYIGKDKYNLEAIRNSIDVRPLSVEIAIKKYPCNGRVPNMIDNIISLLTENNLDFEDIERMDVYDFPDFPYHEPAYGFQGRFSSLYIAATAMIDKRIDIDSFTDEKLNRPQCRQAMSKLVGHIRSSFESKHPLSDETPVSITLKDGRTVSGSNQRNYLSMHGSPGDPLTDEEITYKFKASAALILPKNKVSRACDMWWNMEEMTNISEGLKTVAIKPTPR